MNPVLTDASPRTDWHPLADRVLQGDELTRDEALSIINSEDAELLDLLRHGEGRCWVKLTGVYRLSRQPGFADAAPMAEALLQAAPDRMIWGSDYPHLSFADEVTTGGLFNLLGRWAPSEALRRRVMVDNPATLFGF